MDDYEESEYLSTIVRIEVKYHRCTKIKPGVIPLDATWEYVTWDYNESLLIDGENEVIEVVSQIGSGCKVTHIYEIEEGVSSLLYDLEDDLFACMETTPPDIIENPMETKEYEIRVLYRDGGERTITGTYDKYGLPTDWADFIDHVWSFIRFYGIGEIFDPAQYNKTRRRASDLIFCKVEFDEYGQEYTYIADTDDYEVDDLVVVPAGRDNREAVVKIISIEFRQFEDAPFPIEKTKHILRKYEKQEQEPEVDNGDNED